MSELWTKGAQNYFDSSLWGYLWRASLLATKDGLVMMGVWALNCGVGSGRAEVWEGR